LKLTLPPDWVQQEAQPSSTGLVASLKIPNPEAGGGDGTVQITHYGGAKGKELEDRYIDRWVGQVAKADGSPTTRADAKVSRTQLGPVRLTTVELVGTVRLTAGDAGQPGQRMVGAIVEHPQAVHFIVITGPARSMDKWAPAIDSFLKSAKTE
jgi:hypothetical protein